MKRDWPVQQIAVESVSCLLVFMLKGAEGCHTCTVNVQKLSLIVNHSRLTFTQWVVSGHFHTELVWVWIRLWSSLFDHWYCFFQLHFCVCMMATPQILCSSHWSCAPFVNATHQQDAVKPMTLNNCGAKFGRGMYSLSGRTFWAAHEWSAHTLMTHAATLMKKVKSDFKTALKQ